jgi:hypothetical protein
MHLVSWARTPAGMAPPPPQQAGVLPCRGRGQAVAVAAGSDCVTVVTSRAYLLRYVYTQGSNPGIGQLCGVVYVHAAPYADPLV